MSHYISLQVSTSNVVNMFPIIKTTSSIYYKINGKRGLKIKWNFELKKLIYVM